MIRRERSLRRRGAVGCSPEENRSRPARVGTKVRAAFLLATVVAAGAAAAHAAPDLSARGPEIHVTRAAGPITIDGDLADPGWRGAARVDTWFETRPGDNVPPKVKSVGYVTYDDRYFYAGFHFYDPDPSRIRAPYADHDDISEAIDYGGVILDTRNDGRTAVLFLATPRGVEYDSVSNDATGNEDASPDFYWDAAGRITSDGWVLEIRIPFSSLRYTGSGPQSWGIMLFRNYPREFRYQFFSMPLPRGSSCFVCHANPLTGLDGLPSAEHLVVAPYLSAKQEALPRGDLGTPLANGPTDLTGGVDVKWLPTPDSAVDATINPDFSQVESDVAQISANERFALLYPEKRPFFLEGNELFATPIQAVYTRAITSPRWGARATGKSGDTAYTVLAADDRGGGSAIIPGPDASSFADQDFASRVAVARVRRDLGASFVSFLATDREIAGGGSNRVFGPDFQWRPNGADTVTGQILFSTSRTPNRPDLAAEWDGRSLSGGAADVWWSHSTRHFDASAEVKAFADGFRADDGFVPQVGFHETYAELGYSWLPTGFFSRVRVFALTDPMWADGGRLRTLVAAGVATEGRWNSFAKLWVYADRWRVAVPGVAPASAPMIPQTQVRFSLQATPSQAISGISFEGWFGEQIDFANARPGRGATLKLALSSRTTDHLALRLDAERRWIDVRPDGGGPRQRLLTAQVERLKATWMFNARSYARLIGQYERTDSDPALFRSAVDAHSGSLTGSALIAYKLNWQSVLFLGYGDERTIDAAGELRRSARQFFLKASYAMQW